MAGCKNPGETAAWASSNVDRHGEDAGTAKPPPSVPATDKSIAVLPFANLSDDKANAYFADGMQDEILTKLSKIGALRVISRTSTQRYASAPQNLAEIAHQLGVANVLEGSVQKSGNAVHINVQLIGAAKDEHLWAESYNRTLDDIFGVEGEVAQAVADALKATLTGAEREVVAAKGTENPKPTRPICAAGPRTTTPIRMPARPSRSTIISKPCARTRNSPKHGRRRRLR